MSDIRNVLKKLRKERGYSNARDLCDILGISYSTYHNYESGSRVPSVDILIQLADFYKIPVDMILCRSEYCTTLSDAEKEIIDIFRHLSEKQQGEIIGRAKSMIDD